MSGFKDHFSNNAANYADYRPGYPPELFAWLAGQAPARELAWDCATGTGQAAVGLAAHFRQVIATDASATQVAGAESRATIDYRCAPAEASGLASASCDLVSVAQALHWFDHPAFYREAERVLKPGGLLAVWSYGLLNITPAIDRMLYDFYTDTLGPYWPPERLHIENGLHDLPFPYPEIATPPFAMRAEWNIEQLLGYLRTWSAVRRYIAEEGQDPLPPLATTLASLWGSAERRRAVTWPLSLRCGHRP